MQPENAVSRARGALNSRLFAAARYIVSKSHSLVLSASDVEHQMPLISPPSIRTEAPVIHFAWGDTI